MEPAFSWCAGTQLVSGEGHKPQIRQATPAMKGGRSGPYDICDRGLSACPTDVMS